MIYIGFFFFLFFYYYNIGTQLQAVFNMFGIPDGFKSVLTQGMALLFAIALFMQSRNKGLTLRQFRQIAVIWLLWMVYLFLRVNFADPYSTQKLEMVVLQFSSVLMLCVALNRDPDRFSRLFFYATTLMVAALLVAFIVNQTNTMYGIQVERLSIDNVNPIMLSRTFAIGILVVFLWLPVPYWARFLLCLPFLYGMILTGSRGPFISLAVVLFFYYVWMKTKSTQVLLKPLLVCCMLFAVWFVGSFFQDEVDTFLHHGDYARGIYETSGRAQMFSMALREFSTAPISGMGLGQYGKETTTLGRSFSLTSSRPSNEYIKIYPHNLPLEILSELGIVGILLFLWLLRPGAWMVNLSNKFVFLFWLCVLFSLTSGDMFANSGVVIFCFIARFNHQRMIMAAKEGGP